jgi:GT2 family glycosyltransferase
MNTTASIRGRHLAFIIVSYNTRALLDDCLASIYGQTRGISFEIVVVDNASHDGSADMVRRKYPEVTLVESGGNIGFGRANNLGFEHTQAPYVMLLNSDAVLLEDTGTALVDFLERTPRAGLVGPGVVLMDGTRQPKTCGHLPTARVVLNQYFLLCRLFPRIRFFGGLYVEHHARAASRIGWISGVCMVIRREAYAAVGGFDPAIFMYAEDVDLCRRCATKGWETWRVDGYAVKHFCGGSTKSAEQLLGLYIIQQRNFLRLLDVSLGPIGRLIARCGLVSGLLMRVGARAALWPFASASRRFALRADVHCLADSVGLSSYSKESSHAHRA